MFNSSLSTKSIGQQLGEDQGNTSVVFAQTAPNRVDLIERLSIGTLPGEDFTITHIARKRPGHGMTDGADNGLAFGR
jgi:hypothetical protein